MRATTEQVVGVHLVVGGYPPGEPAGHDMDFARLRLLELLATEHGVRTTVASDFADLGRWLDRLRERGLSILLTEQNALFALSHTDRGYVMLKGRITHQAAAADLRQSQAVRSALGVG